MGLTAAGTSKCLCGSQQSAAVTATRGWSKFFWNHQSFCSGPSRGSSVNQLACNGITGSCQSCPASIGSCSDLQVPMWQSGPCSCEWPVKVFLGPVKVFVLGHHGVAVQTNWNAMGSLGPASAAQLALMAAVTCRCPCGSQQPAAVTVKVFGNGQSFCSGPS